MAPRLRPVETVRASLCCLRTKEKGRRHDCLFGLFGELKLDEFPALGDWTPSMDVSETKEASVVKAEVPGLGPTDIQISLQDSTSPSRVSEARRRKRRTGGTTGWNGPTPVLRAACGSRSAWTLAE